MSSTSAAPGAIAAPIVNANARAAALLASAFDKAAETAGFGEVLMHGVLAEQAEETDSAGQTWDVELHASTKSKNADGTWKKRRGARDPRDVASDPAGTLIHELGAPLVAAPIAPPVPPAPAAPVEPIMPKIFALITSQIVTINQAVEAAQAEGFADLGANGLGGAPVEKQLAVLRKLEG